MKFVLPTMSLMLALAVNSITMAVAAVDDIDAPPGTAMPAGQTPAVADTTAEQQSYLLGPDDVLNVTVLNFPNLSTRVAVMPDGKISVPLVGTVYVAGKTSGQVEQDLEHRWREYILHPAVSISLQQKRLQSVYVYGYVARPGGTDLSGQQHVFEALAQAGGALATADLKNVVITHKTGAKETVDLSHPEDKSGTAADLLLSANDTIYVPQRHIQYTVVGQVNHPGSYDFQDDMTILQAMTLVGGVIDGADLDNATWTHDGIDRKLDLMGLLKRGDMSINAKLDPGDTIVVPELPRTYVFGQVKNPGYYTYKAGDRLLDALNGVGGPTASANMKKVNYVHIDKVTKTATVTKINLDDFLIRGDIKADVPLTPGDAIYVGEKQPKVTLSDGIRMLAGLATLGVGRVFSAL